jgi:membrane protein DedA with SNARE-associated domain
MIRGIISFIISYGYLTLFLGGIFEGETVLLLGGTAVYEGYLIFGFALLFSVLGASLGDLLWFIAGRFYGEKIINRFVWVKKATSGPIYFINQKPELLAFFMRFMYGFRNIIPFSLGMSSIKTTRFILFNLFGAICWALFLLSAGYALGGTIDSLIGRIKKIEFSLVAIILILISVFYWAKSKIGIFLNKKFVSVDSDPNKKL